MKKLPTILRTLAILATCSIGFADEQRGDAEAHPYFTDRLQISAGAFFPSFDTKISLDGDNGRVGTLMDAEHLLGLDDTIATPIADILWRITDKHRLLFSYFNLDRDGTKNLSRSINVGNQTYPAGIDVKSQLDISVYRVGYDYSLINDGRKEFGLGLAVDLMPIEASVQAAGLAEREDILLAVPTVGLHAAYGISKKLVLIGRLNGIYFDFDTSSGSVLNPVAILEYNAFERFSVGAGYAYYRIDVEADYSGFDGTLDFEYHGPLFYMKLLF
jgi:hypothetical protein